MRACGCVWTLQMYLISLLFGVNYFIITFLHNDVGFFFLLIFYYLIILRIWLNFRLLLEKQNRLKAEGEVMLIIKFTLTQLQTLIWSYMSGTKLWL